MDKKIYKYDLQVGRPDTRVMLRGPVVHVDSQDDDLHDELQLWAEHKYNDYDHIERTFSVFGTGERIPEGWTYVGTALVHPFVWHVYEKEQE